NSITYSPNVRREIATYEGCGEVFQRIGSGCLPPYSLLHPPTLFALPLATLVKT
ncbi:hypothetical protein J6590_078851, partial [Homalodisca vitripennis]